MTNADDLLKPEEVATALRVGRTKLYELIRDGRLPAIRIDGLVRIRRGDLDNWIAANSTSAARPKPKEHRSAAGD